MIPQIESVLSYFHALAHAILSNRLSHWHHLYIKYFSINSVALTHLLHFIPHLTLQKRSLAIFVLLPFQWFFTTCHLLRWVFCNCLIHPNERQT